MMPPSSHPERILVVKLGALGDFLYAAGPMFAIRRHHKDAQLTLLTRPAYANLARQMGIFDDILIDPVPGYNPLDWFAFRKTLNARPFTRVYDLQNNARSGRYFHLFSPRPEWVGIAPGASHRNADPDRRRRHAFIGLRDNLRLAGIDDVALDRLDWLKGDRTAFDIAPPYALIVPGSAPSRPLKRWPARHYRALAEKLIAAGIRPVILGSPTEGALCRDIAAGLPVLDLAGLTSIADIAGLARDAAVAVGNDTGPMHVISLTGCPSLLFFRRDESTVEKHGPQNAFSVSVEADDLDDVTADDIFERLMALKK